MALWGKHTLWIKQFIPRQREQRVMMNGSYSKWEPVVRGIPQGSVIEPFLFILCVNSMPDVVLSTIYLFADDARIYQTIGSQEDQIQLQRDLYNLQSWSNESLQRFNETKCLLLSLSTKRVANERTYSLNRTTQLRNVCLETDAWPDHKPQIRFSFDEHIAAKVKKINSIVAVIKKSFVKLELKVFGLLFKTLVRPHLEYVGALSQLNMMKHRMAN